MAAHPTPPAPRAPIGGGAPFVGSLLAGVVIGFLMGQTTVGFLIGGGVGLAIVAALAWRERH